VVKYFRFSVDYILWEISYANLMMLLATIPKYEAPDRDKEKVEDVGDLSNIFKD
jgi:hypothetical protein